MLEQIRTFFYGKMDPKSDPDPTSRKNRIALATAAIMLEMAHADSNFSLMEKEEVLKILRDRFQLSTKDSVELLEIAEQARNKALDIWQFTNLINMNFSDREKRELLELLWHIAFIDGRIDMYEEYLMRKLSNLLNMDHSEFIDAKFRAKQQLNKNKTGV